MKARGLFNRRVELGDNAFADVVLWELDGPVPPCRHPYKYRLAFVVGDECVIRYDNERGKGDHRHTGGRELPYVFRDVNRLVADFFSEAKRWLDENRND